MIRSISLHNLFHDVDLIPQAIVNEPIYVVARRLDVSPESGYDDLDEFEGMGFVLNDKVKFALMRYRGHPKNTATIYLSNAITDVGKITDLVGRITRELDIPTTAISWQRKDNPLL